jgi:hypothetical protein
VSEFERNSGQSQRVTDEKEGQRSAVGVRCNARPARESAEVMHGSGRAGGYRMVNGAPV